MSLLKVEKLSFAYGERATLNDVALTLSAGEIVTLIGPNGSGKSTLLRILLGHLHGKGSVAWEGKEIGAWRRRELAKLVAYLPQSPHHEPGETVLDVLRLGRAPYWGAFGLESSADAQAVGEVAKLLDLGDLLDRPMENLSGGQRQRVFIGRCLAQRPRALLLDEPNTFLDLGYQLDLCGRLRELARGSGLAVLMASHELNLAGGMADRLILLNRGTVAATGSADEVLRPEILSPVYGVAMQRFVGEGEIPVVAAVVKRDRNESRRKEVQ